ncbi:MAG: TIGR04283 family arsenosugar biosynthesis glycosyltransferase [Nitrospira sp.]|nr:TIGR04283 family arsenosugar biosynthesis glycosyltransferase [Nitrospira sp.]MCP9441199.1 TIGR04283 family arsenosugar biosynthesis glycosyltransferase [Nitrospira sp.]
MIVSVIIPTLHERDLLTKTILHTAELGFDEIVVVDGGSTDGTMALAKACCAGLTGAHVITAPRGRARQMNEGAKVSRGEGLLFLHADTLLPPNAKALITSALADSGIAGGRFDVRFDSSSPWGRMISTLMNIRSRWTGIATGDQAIFVRRSVFDQLGGFADIPLMEDIEFSRRLKRTGRIAALRQTVTTSFRRWETQGPLKTIVLMWTLRLLYWLGVSPHRLSDFYAVIR